jgi:hypothetical protein
MVQHLGISRFADGIKGQGAAFHSLDYRSDVEKRIVLKGMAFRRHLEARCDIPGMNLGDDANKR